MLYSLLLTLLLTYAKETFQYLSEGVLIWFHQMLPALFPAILWSNLVIQSGHAHHISRFCYPLIHRLFGLSKTGSFAFLVGFLCGFPLGAKTTCALYEQRKLSKQEATYLLSFCNMIGPAFLVSYFIPHAQIKHLTLLFFLHFAPPLCYGYLQYHLWIKKPFVELVENTDSNNMETQNTTKSLLSVLDESIKQSIDAIVVLGGYLISMQLLRLALLPLPHHVRDYLLPFIEINTGIERLTSSPPGPFLKCLMIIALSFTGLCCFFQARHDMQRAKLSFRSYVLHKCILTLMSALFCGVCAYLGYIE